MLTRRQVVAGLFALFGLAGCADAASTKPPEVAKAHGKPTATAKPKNAFASGGLGLALADWEQAHGKGKKDNIGWLHYEKDRYVLAATETNVWHIEASWGKGRATKTEAAAEATKLSPADAKFLGRYRAGNSGAMVEHFHSPSLANRFPKEIEAGNATISLWPEGEPGDFIAIYRDQEGEDRITGIILGIGNNP